MYDAALASDAQQVDRFKALVRLREIIRSFQGHGKDFSGGLAARCSRFNFRLSRQRRFYGKADEDHYRNRFAVDLAGPKFPTRMVFPMRGGGGDGRTQ
jgi:hypothetical protein